MFRGKRLRTIQIMVFIAFSGLVYSYTWRGGVMQNSIVDLTAAIVEDGTFVIDDYHANSKDVSFKDGHYYSGMPPGVSILAIPFYGIAKVALAPKSLPLYRFYGNMEGGLPHVRAIYDTPHAKAQFVTHFLLTVVLGAGVAALSYSLVVSVVRGLSGDQWIGRATGLVYAFGTTVAYFSGSYYTQSVALFLLWASVHFLFVRKELPLNAALGALCAGVAGSCDYPFFLYGGIVVFFGFLRYGGFRAGWRKVGAMGYAYLLPLVLVLVYQLICFGNPLETPYGHRAVATYKHAQGVLGLGAPSLNRLEALLLSPYEGILLLCPVLVFAPLGFVHLWRLTRREGGAGAGVEARRNRLMLIMIACIVGASVLFFASVPWRSRGAFAPRYSLCAVAFMAALSYPYWRKLLPLYVLLLVYSVTVCHLTLLEIRPFVVLSEWVRTGTVAAPKVVVWPAWELFWWKGLLFDAGYQLGLIGLIFGLPGLVGWVWRKTGLRSVHA